MDAGGREPARQPDREGPARGRGGQGTGPPEGAGFTRANYRHTAQLLRYQGDGPGKRRPIERLGAQEGWGKGAMVMLEQTAWLDFEKKAKGACAGAMEYFLVCSLFPAGGHDFDICNALFVFLNVDPIRLG